MKKWTYPVLAIAAVAIVLPTPAASSLATVMVSFVTRQTVTPGVVETGHLNISGTAKSGKVETGSFRLGTVASAGKVLTANASGFGTWQSPFFPVPFIATAAVNGPTIGGSSTHANGVGVDGTASGATGYGIVGTSTSPTGYNYGGWFSSVSKSGTGVRGYASATSGITEGGQFVCLSPTGFGLYAQNLATTGKTYSAYCYQVAPAGAAVYGLSATLTGNSAGGLFSSAGPTGSGVTGSSSGATGYGGYFASTGTAGKGVYGLASSTTGATNGGRFDSASPSGVGVYGYCSSGTGYTYSGYFYNSSTSGRGIGVLAAATTGAAHGAVIETRAASGRAVWATASELNGNNYGGWFESKSTHGIGLYGYCSGTGAAIPMGVVGTADDPNGYGVYSYGKTGATGTKSFRIDYPFDPENKYLMHYCVEGPVPQNVYNGRAVTDSRGYAWVTLPDYCEAITKDFLYQVTVLDGSDDFVQVKVTKPVAHNRFQIRTSKGGVEVCWEVKGTRNDAYMRAHPSTDIEDKPASDRGTYTDPALYGKPKERGILFRMNHAGVSSNGPMP